MASWVLLRGLTREARHWGDLPARLRAQGPGQAVFTPDLPGNGTRHAQTSPASVPAMVEALREHLRRQGATPPYQVLAMSLGAMVAVAWAERHPHELQHAVLVNTSLRPHSPWHQRLQPANYPALLGLAWHWHDARRCEAEVLRLTSHRPPGAATAALLRDWTAWRTQHPVSRANAGRQLLAALRYRAPARRPAVPLLLLASRGDGLVAHACSVALAQHWGCPLALHASAGHDLPLDDSDWVLAQIGQWLAAT